jgi:hypothetical protein
MDQNRAGELVHRERSRPPITPSADAVIVLRIRHDVQEVERGGRWIRARDSMSADEIN